MLALSREAIGRLVGRLVRRKPGSVPVPIPASWQGLLIQGIDSNYYGSMLEQGKVWLHQDDQVDPLVLLQEAGARWLRLRVFAKRTGENGFNYARDLALKAQRTGLTPFVTLFLSDRWASAVDQPAVEGWKKLSVEQRARRVRKYVRRTVRKLRAAGLETNLLQIGNEIDYGFCGVFSDEIFRREGVDWMRANIWPDEATLLAACVQGIRDTAPTARIVIHIAHWFNHEFAIGFFRTMQDLGVEFDFMGASYYPSSGIPMQHFGIPNTLKELAVYVDAVTGATGKPLIFSEYGYPSQPAFGGAFAHWHHPVPGFPLTAEGQRDWLRSFLTWCIEHPKVAGAFYWSPEYYHHEDWEAFAFFDRDGKSRPVLEAYRECSKKCVAPELAPLPRSS